MAKRFFIILLLLMIFTGCNLIACGWKADLTEFDEYPTPEMITGKYKLDKKTLKSIPEFKNAYSTELILNQNGSYIIKDIPVSTFDLFNEYSDSEKKVNITGYWKIEIGRYNPKLDVNLKFDKEYSKLNFGTKNWDILKKNENPVIFIILGDPDSCEALRFIKSN